MELRFQCNVRDYLEAQNAYYWRSTRGIASGCVLIGLILLAVWTTAIGSPNGYSLFGLVVLWVLMMFAWRSWYFRRDFRKHPNFSREQTLKIEESGLSYESDVARSEVQWSAFTRFTETRNLFMLFPGARIFHIVPKRALSSSELDEFRALLQKKVAAK